MVSLPDGFHGAYQRHELVRLIGRSNVRAAIQHGELSPFARDVLVDTHMSASLMTRAAATQLLAGPTGAFTGLTTLALHGCAAASTGPIHLLLPYYRKLDPRPGVVVHHGIVEDGDVSDVAGLRTVALEYALVEVLCREDRWDALASADQAFAMTPEAERAELRASIGARLRLRRDSRGRRRARVLLNMVTGLPESPPESWLLVVMADGGLPMPVSQYRVADLRGREVYRLDFAWPELRIAVEYDGYEAHVGRAHLDAVREEDLRRRGWIVVRANHADLRDSSRLIAEVKSAFAARSALAA